MCAASARALVEELTHTATPAVGCYQDPQNASMKRYWDGTHWTEQTQLTAAVPPPLSSSGQAMPKKYLVESILATIFRCLPLGVVGTVFSSKVESLYKAGAYAEAQEACETSFYKTGLGSNASAPRSWLFTRDNTRPPTRPTRAGIARLWNDTRAISPMRCHSAELCWLAHSGNRSPSAA